jgi:septal ring factor EnvC (AmiA/AmiB activator)
MTTHQEPDILAQLERLNLKTDSNTTAISQLAELMRFQMVQSERDRQHFQNSITEINQRQQAQLEAVIIGFREISSRVDDSIRQADIDRDNFIDQISDMQEQAAADRQQAAIDRQQFQEEIKRIWEYLYLLQGRNGNTP